MFVYSQEASFHYPDRKKHREMQEPIKYKECL